MLTFKLTQNQDGFWKYMFFDDAITVTHKDYYVSREKCVDAAKIALRGLDKYATLNADNLKLVVNNV